MKSLLKLHILIIASVLTASCAKEQEQTISRIYFDDKEIDIEIGKDKKLSLIQEPNIKTNLTYDWSSSDKEIATVDENGIVKPLKVGKAIISALNKQLNLQASISLNVIHPSISSIQIDAPKTALNVGESVSLSVQISPVNAHLNAQDIEWSVSDEEIAKINNEGLLTALNEGVTRVIASVKDKNMQSTIEISVSHVYIEDFLLKEIPNIVWLGSPFKLEFENITPDNATTNKLFTELITEELGTIRIDDNYIITPLKEGVGMFWIGTKNNPKKHKVTVLVRDKYRELGKEYQASNGITVKVTKIDGYRQNAQYNYHIINYQLTNNTSQPINETSFRILLLDNSDSYSNVNIKGVIKPNETVYRTLGRIIPINKVAESFNYGGLYWEAKEIMNVN